MYNLTTAYIHVHTRTYVRTYMYVPHLEFLADKGAEIEMAARSRFLGSRLGVLDRDAPLEKKGLLSSIMCVILAQGPMFEWIPISLVSWKAVLVTMNCVKWAASFCNAHHIIFHHDEGNRRERNAKNIWHIFSLRPIIGE